MNLLLEGEESRRLIFRKVSKSDFNAWLPFHQEPLSSRYFAGENSEPDVACRNWFTKVFTRYENNLGGLNALISKDSGQLIGMCGLLIQTVDEIQELEIGYSILPEYWKKGYATEAAKKCKSYGFDRKLAESIISIIHIDNIGSQKVALNNGMHLDKTTTYKGIPVHIFRVLLNPNR
ncbi:MAG: GNAT family N-acetyltransferase [Eudoraea sp.]|uniref:GNAT family N-acetyltransferase n=1 Tax=Eudoraea sp. TaxID=1979955 RepID=UPI003C72CA8C